MKPIGRKNYGSIPHLHNSKLGEGDYYIGEGQERILTLKARDRHDNILVFEKYDGSNVGVAKFENKIFALTRSGYEASTSPYKQHHYFANWVKKRELLFADMLQNGERITGEWLAQAHGLIYKIEVEPIVFFDYFTPNNERVLFEELRAKAIEYGVQLPRKIHEGQPITVDQLLPLLNEKTKGIESVELPEGMVYRVERKGKVDFLAKYVRSDFPTGQFCINVEEQNLIWNNIKDKKPLAYQSVWDGKKSDKVLVCTLSGKYYVAEMYEGILDGSEFCDFYDDRDFEIENVAFWTEIDSPF